MLIILVWTEGLNAFKRTRMRLVNENEPVSEQGPKVDRRPKRIETYVVWAGPQNLFTGTGLKPPSS